MTVSTNLEAICLKFIGYLHWTIFDELNNENDKAINKTLEADSSLLKYCTPLNIKITSAKVPFYFIRHY